MRGKRLFAILLVLGLTAAGCGSDDDGDDTAATTGSTEAEADAAEVPVFEVKASEVGDKFTFALPDDMQGGAITIRLVNDGKATHDFQLAKKVDGHTLDELLKQVSSEEEPLTDWVKAAGGVGSTAPGQSNEATVDLEEGDYWYFCTESSDGPSEDAPSIPHSTHGMAGELTVTGDSGAELPEADASIEAVDYSFTTSGLKAGSNTFSFTNKGQQIHHTLLFPVAAGKTFDEAKAALLSDKEPTGPPPIDFEHARATAVIDPGQTLVTTADLAAGTYTLVCFMPDKGTAGPPHLTKGMLAEVKVA